MNIDARRSLARFAKLVQKKYPDAIESTPAPKMPKVRGLKTKSRDLETDFERMLIAHEVGGFVRHFRFHPSRKWEMDFAWPDQRFAVEVDGAVFATTRYGHTSPTGIRRDYERDAAALALGWVVFRITDEMIPRIDTINIVRRWTAGARRAAIVTQAALNI